MQVMVVVEAKKQVDAVNEAFKKSRHSVVCCRTANEVMARLEQSIPDLLCLDVCAWKTGRAIYNYFNTLQRLETVPLVFFNAPADFSGINGRQKKENDQVLPKPTDIQDVIKQIQSKT